MLTYLLSYIYNDCISETILTLLFAYFVFFFGEYGLAMISHEVVTFYHSPHPTTSPGSRCA